MAWALIGGLISSMFLTMVVVPVIITCFDRILARFGKDQKKEIHIEEKALEEEESEVAEYVY
ncbi:hypothetical protein QWY93_19235 [Echinicola jeungdonensis]|uniref:hypothetical protein n=1 Tax=Echinicola jeungdonensis TaxID=709343 RepID=UPI0025B59100|nr:hypothetical protein [Echinicola jeungdonensis]MDN3671393.1 hypothetical protein [Echinicola jeungdonensis]